jgi:16S rRNA (cytosine1402-N4)-methyltransferase
MHTPVLLNEVVEALDVHPGGVYIDGTLGEGGHTMAIAERGGKVLAIDWDDSQVKSQKSKVKNFDVTFTQGNYAEILRIANENGFKEVDGIVFDFGLSMRQLSESKRGFSYKNPDEPLDMRIGDDQMPTAADIINTFTEEQLYDVFARYSEELHSRELSEYIVRARTIKNFETVGDLLKVIDAVISDCQASHGHKADAIYAQIFQALRVCVNSEYDNIRAGLSGALSLLKLNGNLAVITFHSGEDRIVKQFARENSLKMTVVKGSWEKKFERSAILRVIGKK